MKEHFRIATWNIGGAHTIKSADTFDYDKENLSYFAETLKPLHLDVICLQESHTNDEHTVSERLAKMLDMDFVFDAPRSPSHIDESYQLADAIISKHPIKNTRHVLLPDPPFELHFSNGRKARLFRTYIQTAQILGVTFSNTHLQPLHLFGYDWGQKEGKQLASDTERVFLNNVKKPLIFAGDFNAPNLEKDFSQLFTSLDLRPALGKHPTDIKGNKMDYILYSPEFVAQDAEVVKTDKSDHFLGWAELKLHYK